MKRRHKIALLILAVTVFVNLFSWHFKKMVDWYRLYIFPIGTNTLARFMSLFPFSVGEILIVLGILVVAGAIVVMILRLIAKKKFLNFFRRYREFVCWILLVIFVTETFHCFVLYHATTVEATYYKEVEFDETTLVELYEYLVENANELAKQLERDEKGEAVYRGDLYGECKEAMQVLGEDYPYLQGYYPDPKPIKCSDFMSQLNLAGVYFPFTLEANYNQTMYGVNCPATICHELSHLKGIILEDEANYFGFLACIGSKDPYVRYSGYLSVLPYVCREVKNTISKEVCATLVQPDIYVQKDMMFLTEEDRERVEKKAIISTETANEVTDAFLETTLKSNGVKDGRKSYSRVVRLLLAWYEK